MKTKIALLFSCAVMIILGGSNFTPSPVTNFTNSSKPASLSVPAERLQDSKIDLPVVLPIDAVGGLDNSPVEPIVIDPVQPVPTSATEVPPETSSGDQAINPLTGLPVQNPANLLLPPALVTITNWPSSARPQAGLTFSPIVFEWYIGEGMSRYQALFYGDYPEKGVPPGSPANYNNNNNSTGDSNSNGNSPQPNSDDVSLGPIRSGRLPFEKVRSLYNGFLIMASAYKGVAQHLSQFSNVFGSDDTNINSAMIKVTQLQNIAAATQKITGKMNLTGMTFDSTPPPGGQPASRLWFMYNILNEAIWNYDASAGAYHRYQYTQDNKNTFIADTDRLNGNPLSYNNVVILFAEHRACTETAFDVDLMYVNRAPALLFRDGQVYKIFWTTKNGDYEKTTGKVRPIRFIDDQGNPFPFKPGQTWIHVMPLRNFVWETAQNPDVDAMLTDQKKVDSELLYNWIKRPQPGSGIWATQYAASLMIQDDTVCQSIRNMK